MKFSTFAQYLEKLESTTKRLEMIDILAELIDKLDPEETASAIYLASGYLKAPYEAVKFNIAEKMMYRVISNTYSTKEKQYSNEDVEKTYKELGDLGNTAYEICNRTTAEDITINKVHELLLYVAQTEGAGSQDKKVERLSKVLEKMDKISAKYTVRIVLGTTRLGFTETTIIEALAKYLGDRKLKPKIEARYNIHPDIGLVVKTAKKQGLGGLDDISLEPGIPVLSQKAQRVGGFMEEVIERIPTVWLEYKFDGTRVQLHMNRNFDMSNFREKNQSLFAKQEDKLLIRTYTRNLEETTHQYPDIVEAAKKQIDAESVILDGEAIGYDAESDTFLPFQETIQRKRKHGVSETALEIPLKYFVFDILYLNGKSLIDLPLRERRRKLKEIIKKGETIEIAEHEETSSLEELKNYYEDAKESQLEGLIAKNPEDSYQAGARSYSWIKLKTADETLLDDAVDCVVLGYYFGKGVRAKFGIGGFLVGIYDEEEDKFRTISKIGTGLKESDWEKMKKLADKVAIDQNPKNVEMDKIFKPDVFTKPDIVVEIGADEISKSPTHTAGYALRFPRLLKFRTDKPPTQATTLEEIRDMFNKQRIPTKKDKVQSKK